MRINKTRHKRKKIKKNKSRKKIKNKKVYEENDYMSGEGMLTSVWGPPLWHALHTISFNYPVNPTKKQKKQYKLLIQNLQHTLPCKYCRQNLKKNLKQLPLTSKALKNRHAFSLYVYNLHELVNKMLKKKSNLTFEEVRERYEHFRSRCTKDTKKNKKYEVRALKLKKINKTKKKEKGCVEPLYGKKSKCLIKIVPKENKDKTFEIDKKCIKKRFN
jgi:hypothetical protein